MVIGRALIIISEVVGPHITHVAHVPAPHLVVIHVVIIHVASTDMATTDVTPNHVAASHVVASHAVVPGLVALVVANPGVSKWVWLLIVISITRRHS